ncbi:CaaX prenyl proteinase Rce1 [Aureobasidium sp. EXF-10727]|nr:CaaX prenyl proteinase Rce1 [Aureobasidium sp. EXF-10727]
MVPTTIDPHVAGGLTVLFTIIYIAPFYLSPTLRSNSIANRNTPSVIKARTRAVFWSCVASIIITVCVLFFRGHVAIVEVLHLLGVYPVNVLDTAKSCLLVAILFAGPLFERAIVEGEWRSWGATAIKETVYDDLIGWRNLVVGPVSEELVFRSLAISLFLLAQFLYTSLFGFIAAFIYLRTSSLVACILAHSFCNWMGLPRFWGRVGQEFGEEMLDQTHTDDGSVTDALRTGTHGQRLPITWTIAYYIVLFAGAIGFWKLRWSLTHSDLALIRF